MAGPIVETAYGKVRGRTEGGIASFLGIPYGASTEGKNRFRPPQPPAPWRGVRDAFAYGPAFPQAQTIEAQAAVPKEVQDAFGTGARRGQLVMDEDALTINVWTPGTEGRRPVLFWIHGGGFVQGSSAAHDGSELARRGDVVIVSANYRLGALGFLYLGELAPDDHPSGNFCFQDHVFGLEWVRDNITAFGGDPGNVTVFGESSGGASTSSVVAMPSSTGLVHHAICQSGTLLDAAPKDRATAVAERFLAELELTPARVHELADVPFERIVDVQVALSGAAVLQSRTSVDRPGPTVDGLSLPQQPAELIASGASRDVPVMVGATAHECSMFLLSDPEFGTMSHEGVVARLQVLAGDRAVSIHEAYRAARPDDSPTDLMVAAFTDQRFRVASIDWSEAKIGAGGTVYQYLFTWETPVLAGKLRSCHALEVPFVFGSQDRSAIAKDGPPSLSESMSATWAAFARNGDPDNDRIPHWPTYDTERRATMIFDDTCRVEDDPFAAERRAWR